MGKRRGLVVAGTQSGSGKTVVTMGLLSALGRKGFEIRPFKCGPDFIDPRFHEWIVGRTSINLDPYFLEPSSLSELYDRSAEGLSGGVVEGVMGFYDGIEKGTSTFDIATTLGLPVLLVMPSRGIAETIGALVRGLLEHRSGWTPLGILATQTGSDRHGDILASTLEREGLPPLVGTVPRNEKLSLPERHLGLVTRWELEKDGTLDAFRAVLDRCADGWDWNRLTSSFVPAKPVSDTPGIRQYQGLGKIRLGVAWDEAFRFYYHENFAALEKRGVEIVPFSPLSDPNLPDGLDGLYIGGGYPEVYARELSANRTLIDSMRVFAGSGKPIYAECGGMLYLTEGPAGEDWTWVGLFPWRFRMKERLKRLGYAEATPSDGHFLSEGKSSVRGHLFHYSELVSGGVADPCTLNPAFFVSGNPEGFSLGNIVASYLHLYFPSNPSILDSWIRSLSRSGEKRHDGDGRRPLERRGP